MQLTTENRVVVNLEQTKDVLLQLDLHGREIIDRVEPQKMAIGASDEYMRFETITLLITNRYCTSNLLIL